MELNISHKLEQSLVELNQKIDLLISNKSGMESDPGERLTRKEVKEIYKISYVTIHKLMKEQELPYVKIGRKTLFKRTDVENLFCNEG